MSMKPKHKPCINCGANEYEIKSLNTLKCEYCGTEYEIEFPEWGVVPLPYTTCLTASFVDGVDYDYRNNETRYYNERGELIRTDH